MHAAIRSSRREGLDSYLVGSGALRCLCDAIMSSCEMRTLLSRRLALEEESCEGIVPVALPVVSIGLCPRSSAFESGRGIMFPDSEINSSILAHTNLFAAVNRRGC